MQPPASLRRPRRRRGPLGTLITWLARPREPLRVGSSPRVPRGLQDGAIDLEVVLAVVADLQVQTDEEGRNRASFMLEGHLPATQLSADGVTVVALEALRISDLAVSDHVVERLGAWERREAGITGLVHFDREAIDGYRGRGPLRDLLLADEDGAEIVLRRQAAG